MPRNPDVSNVSRRWFLALAGGAAAANTLATGLDPELTQAAPSPPTTTTYQITVDVSNAVNLKTPPIYYTPKLPNARSVSGVKANETFSWRVHTKSHPANQYHLAILFKDHSTPFVDATSGNSQVYEFYGTENDEAAGGTGINAKIDTNALLQYDYYVLVFDHKAKYIYFDDPSIIIGDGLLAAEKNLIKASRDLEKAASEDAAKREKIIAIDKQLRSLINEFKKP
jgi:hypothetical protein